MRNNGPEGTYSLSQPISQNRSHDPSPITRDAERHRGVHLYLLITTLYSAWAALCTEPGAFEIPTKVRDGPCPGEDHSKALHGTPMVMNYQPRLISIIAVVTKLMIMGWK